MSRDGVWRIVPRINGIATDEAAVSVKHFILRSRLPSPYRWEKCEPNDWLRAESTAGETRYYAQPHSECLLQGEMKIQRRLKTIIPLLQYVDLVWVLRLLQIFLIFCWIFDRPLSMLNRMKETFSYLAVRLMVTSSSATSHFGNFFYLFGHWLHGGAKVN